MRKWALLLAMWFSYPAFGGTYEIVLAAKACRDIGPDKQVECTFSVGRDLRIDIAGIGTFSRSNAGGDYYATIGGLHDCIVVKPGPRNKSVTDFAFISPRSARVFKTWQRCKGQ
jgi:hypothetical protein